MNFILFIFLGNFPIVIYLKQKSIKTLRNLLFWLINPGDTMEGGNKNIKKKSHKRDKDLALTISKSGEIKKFNEKCEKTFGYSEIQVKEKSFFKDLIPRKYMVTWQEKFNSAVKNSSINDFKLPILTKNGHEIMISWSSFPIKNSDGKVEDISIVGSFINTWDDSEESFLPSWNEIDKKTINDYGKDDLDKYKLKNQYLKDENKYLKKKLKVYLDKFSDTESHDKDFLGFSIYKLSDIFGGRKRKEEFEAFLEELNDREGYLNNLESKLMEEKRELNKKKINFISWRKKLEKLEADLESRRRWIDKKENSIKKLSDNLNNSSSLDDSFGKHDIIDNINESAAIIQRGILKQVNDSFASLLGYDLSEIINKSLFDFIAPESFADVQKFYKKRLNGEKIFGYKTTFLSKDNKKIDVVIKTKPTILNNDKAEIALIKET